MTGQSTARTELTKRDGTETGVAHRVTAITENQRYDVTFNLHFLPFRRHYPSPFSFFYLLLSNDLTLPCLISLIFELKFLFTNFVKKYQISTVTVYYIDIEKPLRTLNIDSKVKKKYSRVIYFYFQKWQFHDSFLYKNIHLPETHSCQPFRNTYINP